MMKRLFFTQQLIKWNSEVNRREMPWKGEKDPYKIWLSEIILQQTRVSQGLNYYQKFISKYPTVVDLAKASEKDIYKDWEGLGYYSRCKNLIETARLISSKEVSDFPRSFEGLLALKGVGVYTASAIASFAYNLPYAVVDGNVFRLLSRYFGKSISIDSASGKKFFAKLSLELLDKKQSAVYNQAIMDLGAEICKPQLPVCDFCPLKKHCHAYQKNIIKHFPVKERKIAQKNRWFYYLVIKKEDKYILRKRGGGDIWENLYEFILIEQGAETSLKDLEKSVAFKKILGGKVYSIRNISKKYKQKLTHQLIMGEFIEVNCSKIIKPAEYILIDKNELKTLPFPKFIGTYLTDKNVSLNLLKEV